MRKRVLACGIILSVGLLVAFLMTSCGNISSSSDEAAPYSYASGTDIKNHENKLIAELLKTEEDIQYYAYLDLDSAEEEIKDVILAARNLIIHRQSYVVEGEAVITDKNGNIVREVPKFYDLFPEDWDVPGTYELP